MILRRIAPKLPEDKYEQNFADINPPFTPQQSLIEASRCLYCFDAPCIKACPTRIDVPSFIQKIGTGNLKGAARVILSANVLGESCGRVCPTEVLCEGACVLNGSEERPVEIGRLQRYAVDYVLDREIRIFQAGKPNGRRVACIGSGPASLACAAELAQRGYDVTIFDRNPSPGGLNTYGIAAYKTRAADSLREVKMVEALGVKFRQGVEVMGRASHGSAEKATSLTNSLRCHPARSEGSAFQPITADSSSPSALQNDAGAVLGTMAGVAPSLEPVSCVTLDELEARYDAVFVGVGLGETWDLQLPGEDLDGVCGALQFIQRTKSEAFAQIDVGPRVAVIGAGNTAIDAVTAARRLGAESVYLIYRRGEDSMPAFRYEYELAQRDGVTFLWYTTPLAILGRDGAVTGLTCARTRLEGRGRYARVEVVAGSEFVLGVDMVVKALGQRPVTEFLRSIPGVEVNGGRVVVDARTHQAGNPKYYAAGDCVNGGKEVVDAVAEGMTAARGIDALLSHG
ncbi:MAG TPA: NAD(P)-dependent oxidoreductase [Terriglobia bacterium]